MNKSVKKNIAFYSLKKIIKIELTLNEDEWTKKQKLFKF